MTSCVLAQLEIMRDSDDVTGLVLALILVNKNPKMATARNVEDIGGKTGWNCIFMQMDQQLRIRMKT